MTRTLFRVLALSAAALAVSACAVVGVANTAADVVGTGVGAGARVVSSTGDVVFDHDGDGR